MKLSRRFEQLQASSILESVIAISVISICALIALTVYVNIITHNKSLNYYNALQTIKDLKYESIKYKNYENESFVFKDFTIDKEVTLIKEENIVRIKWKLKADNRIVVLNDVITYYEN